jgi:hypothetical protein
MDEKIYSKKEGGGGGQREREEGVGLFILKSPTMGKLKPDTVNSAECSGVFL